jgi:hypothetical protein
MLYLSSYTFSTQVLPLLRKNEEPRANLFLELIITVVEVDDEQDED